MKDYTTYTVLDFSSDEDFRSWVLHPDLENIDFWENLVSQHPYLKDKVTEAAEIIIAVHELSTDNLTEKARQEAVSNLFVKKQPQKQKSLLLRLTIGYNWYKIAAIWFVLIGLATSYYLIKRERIRKDISLTKTELNGPLSRMIVKKNDSLHSITVLLGDGSVIALEKGGELTYPEKFTDSLRTVFLKGEAFFDIAKNPAKPFIVYSETTVTKVLGTSFRIKSSEDNVLVAVKTGKVSVRSFTKSASGTKESIKEIFLSPNQQVLYNRIAENFETGTVKNPQKIASDSDNQELGFDEIPVSDIFHALEKNYGIHISFEESRFSTCRLTTQFTEETLRQRLEAICQVTGAVFRITDGRVIIEGNCEP